MYSNKHKLKPLICIGVGGHFRSIVGFINNAGYYLEKSIDYVSLQNTRQLNLNNILESRFSVKNLYFLIGIGDNYKRSIIYDLLKDNGIDDKQFPNIISRDSILSENVSLGFGNVVFPGAIVNAGTKISNFTIINTQSSVDHDCFIKNFSSIAPGAVLGGNVLIGSHTEIGIGATIKNNITVGDKCVLGGQAYLIRNMPSNSLYYGVPAKIIID